MNKILLKLLVSSALGLLISFFSAANALVCTCENIDTPYAAYKAAKRVFIGKVVDFRDFKSPLSTVSAEDVLGVGYYQVEIQESFKGSKKLAVEFFKSNGGCSSGFTVGETYLIYAYGKSDDSFAITMCTRTVPLAAGKNDVLFIRSLLEKKPEPRIYGSVRRVEENPKSYTERYFNLANIKIVAESGKRKFETVTDKNGLYRFYQLPNGRYRIHAQTPPEYEVNNYDDKEEIVLSSRPVYRGNADFANDGLTAYVDFTADWKNKVCGEVFDAAGQRMDQVIVGLLPANRVNNRFSPVIEDFPSTKTFQGHYCLRAAPGKHVLAVDVEAPFVSPDHKSITYYQQTIDPEKAELISLGENDQKKIDLKLNAGLVLREIEVEVFWSDGTPCQECRVQLSNSKDNWSEGSDLYDSGSTEKGKFKISAFEDAEYWVHTYKFALGMRFPNSPLILFDRGIYDLHAAPVKIKIGKVNAPLKFIIPLPEGLPAPIQ